MGSDQGARSWGRIASGYRLSLAGGASACFVVLIINIAVAAWDAALPDIKGESGGRRVLYEGSCSKAKNINTGLHVFINVLSSVLLGASNYGIQCLSAPTREQIQKDHAKNRYLDIGTVSIRNIFRQTALTRVLVLTLFLSSVPLHLLYNSVVFSSLTVPSEYNIIDADERLVNSEITRTSVLEHTTETSLDSIQETYLWGLLEDSHSPGLFDNLTAAECIDQYSVSFLTSRRDVMLVHEASEDEDMMIHWNTTHFIHGDGRETVGWICSLPGYEPGGGGTRLDDDVWVTPPDDENELCRSKLGDIRAQADNWQPNGYRVKYCLSRPMSQLCRVNFQTSLAIGVIACNLIKMVVLAFVIFYLAPNRLLVLGDAIQSFLSCPDPYSRGRCLMTARHALDMPRHYRRPAQAAVLVTEQKLWISPVSTARRFIGACLYMVSILVSLCLLIWGIMAMKMPKTFPNLWSLGFGQTNDQTLFSSGEPYHSNITNSVILANLPHLIFSLIYFQWNAIFTSMLLGKEWNDFSLRRSSLRVSEKPRGEQRSRYFLQLPYKYSVPLIAASILFHWLLSQSLFLVLVERRHRASLLEEQEALNTFSWGLITCGYSPMAIITCLIAVLVVPLSVLVVGMRRLPGPMPVAGSCSLAIAAACHHLDRAGHPDTALDLLQWGIMADSKKQRVQTDNERDSQEGQGLLEAILSYDHCGFSIHDVEEPQEGRMYA